MKIVSRCNLACDYCFVYRHGDQGWRQQPVLMNAAHLRRVAARISEYARCAHLPHVTVIFHGGEPLLAGTSTIAAFAQQLRSALHDAETSVTLSLQTNGQLLDIVAVQELEASSVWVSVSLDGPRVANDLHRRDRRGRSSFQRTLAALELLEAHPAIYGGVISVVDPRVPPADLFSFMATHQPPVWELLLPDAHHERVPPGRARDPDLYKRWLLEAFDLWFNDYASLRVRLFDSVLAVCAGLPTDTELLGGGGANILTVETDGSYHAHDVLRDHAITSTAFAG